jgi:type IV fimbrial biogenesis protein FimT
MRRISGYTLFELLITLMLATVISAMALPALSAFIERGRLTEVSNSLHQALRYARSEAVSRNARVSVCKTSDGQQCADTGGYEQGWVVFRDAGVAGKLDSPDSVLQVYPGEGEVSVSGNGPVRKYISFVGSGASQFASGAFQAGTITLCSGGWSSKLILSRTGRVRAETQDFACSG